MANNRLFIVDPESGEHFMLAKSNAEGWTIFGDPEEFVARLNEWFVLKDAKATYGAVNAPTSLLLKTEGDI